MRLTVDRSSRRSGTRRSTIWIHDAAGERALVSEGYAEAPRFSRDGTRVFYLDVRDWVLSGPCSEPG